MKVVNKNIKVRIYPSKADKNDKGEKIVSINKIESNIGIHRFIRLKTYIRDYDRLINALKCDSNVSVLIRLQYEYEGILSKSV